MSNECIAWIVAVIVFVAAFVGTLYVIGERNKRTAEQLVKVTEQANAVKIIRHAIDHLAGLGIGENLEYSSARQILELAMMRVIR